MTADEKKPKLVERVTALRGQAIARPRVRLKKRRGLDADQAFLKESEIPYGVMESALARVFSSLVDRQDRTAEGLLLRLNDLQYRVDDLEAGMRDLEEYNPANVKAEDTTLTGNIPKENPGCRE